MRCYWNWNILLWMFLIVAPQGVLILFKAPWNVNQTIKIKKAELNLSNVNISHNKPRLNVIILTHQGSGSSFTGNLFSLHPEVFYLYEPLSGLREEAYKDRDSPSKRTFLDKKTMDAYRIDFSNLLWDFFGCKFKRRKTIEDLFPKWLRNELKNNIVAWGNGKTNLTQETMRKVCNSRRITVVKIMQYRLPDEIGISELQRVCSSEPTQFECLTIHLVRDPRAVLWSVIHRKFFLRNAADRRLVSLRNTPREGKEFVMRYTRRLCSLSEKNLNYVNAEGQNWLKGRYILVRYEDTPGDLFRTVVHMYNFTGLSMDSSIKKWILRGKSPDVKNPKPEFHISKKDVKKIEHWRFKMDTLLVTAIEEECWPLMYMMGYRSINGSKSLQNNASEKLRTEKIPFPFPQ